MSQRSRRILLVGRFHDEAFASLIGESLVAMGHQMVPFDPGPRRSLRGGAIASTVRKARARASELLGSIPAARKAFLRRLLRTAKSEAIDLALVCHDFLLPSEVEALRNAIGGPAVLWFPDHLAQFGRSTFLNAPYDVLFFKDPYIVATLRRENSKRIEYLPECCSPTRHAPVTLTARDRDQYGCDVTTAGNINPSRVAVFEQLSDFDVRIWGNPAPNWLRLGAVEPMLQHRFVAYEEKAKAFLAAKVVVNNLFPAEVWGINVRAFEICAVGAFQILTWRPGLSQLFKVDEEVLAYHDVAELRGLIRRALDDDALRSRVAAAGMKRARSDHTYEHRLRMLLAAAFDGQAGYAMPELT